MRIYPSVFVYTYVGTEVALCGEFVHENGEGRFEYDDSYFANAGAHPLDPVHLPLRKGTFTTQLEGGFFGAFMDCCPQEWGQRVMHLMGQNFVANHRDVIDLDAYVAEGVSDPHNMMLFGSGYGTGSLRFGMAPGMTAAQLEPDLGDCNLYDLSRIRQIAEVLARAEDNRPLTDEEKALLVPGMSLGGARPKALVSDGDDLWIAKFYRAREQVDIQRVELAINSMARKAGIRVAESRAEVIEVDGIERTIFLSKRFDRREGAPVHYISAASVLGAPRSTAARNGVKTDITRAQSQYSYADIAFSLRSMSSAVSEDLHELYRRMVFNAMVGNRDDHLCNHGFLLDPRGPYYRLSPAFDLAIVPNPPPLHPINLGADGPVPSIQNLLSSTSQFGLRRERALEIIREVGAVVADWPRYMARHNVTAEDVNWVRRLMMEGIKDRIARVMTPAERAKADKADTQQQEREEITDWGFRK